VKAQSRQEELRMDKEAYKVMHDRLLAEMRVQLRKKNNSRQIRRTSDRMRRLRARYRRLFQAS